MLKVHQRHQSFGSSFEREPELRRRAALAALGPMVYAVRLPDGIIKIGFSANPASRITRFGPRSQVQVLAIAPGWTLADEQAIHARLRSHVASGREYYHPTVEVLAEVNTMREQVGRGPL